MESKISGDIPIESVKVDFIKILKVVIAGSRTIDNYRLLLNIMNSLAQLFPGYTFEIISGGAEGIDSNARQFAMKNNLKYDEYKPVYQHSNDKRAPLRRNTDMAKDGDLLIAIHDGVSTGTMHMLSEMKKLNKPCYLYTVK